jgi:signal transduction histidine kinase
LIVSPTDRGYRALADHLAAATDAWQSSRAGTIDEAARLVSAGGWDACLVDARADDELLSRWSALGAVKPPVPLVVMVPAGDHQAEVAARATGAVDAVGADADGAALLDRVLRSALFGAERRRLREEISEQRRARRRAEAIARLREELLSAAAHDLRNPLDAMLGWIQLLRTGHLEAADVQRALDTVERNARSQAGIITDLQELARTVTGDLDLDRREVDLAERVRAAADLARESTSRKQLSITLTVPGELRLPADQRRLDQALEMLLRHAVNATPRNGEVAVSVLAGPDHVRVAISDGGSGLPTDLAPFVFDPLGPDDRPPRRLGRAGLELIAARMIVEAHGGSIAASSGHAGRGTTFTLELPRAAGTASGHEA